MGGQLRVPHPSQKIYFACERLYYLPMTIAYLLPVWKTWLRRPARELKR
jgi:hypothetical protein